ncbi:MAG: aspartate dehydrogenase [Eubacteriales bacterium]|nr:aspartate dehydrogenase [Eubacteriales bacterium]
MLFRRKKETGTYDRESLRPALRCSICTGEQTAGFRNIHTGKFQEVTLIRTQEDLDAFMELYGIDEIEKIY